MTAFYDGAPKDDVEAGRTIEFRVLDLRQFRPSAAEAHLSNDEQQRATRFGSTQARDGFIGGRYLVRNALARLLQRDPHAIQLRIEKNGRPLFERGKDDPALSFSLSHSAGIVICAIGVGRIGADVEAARRDRDYGSLEAHVLHTWERQGIDATCGVTREQRFLERWVLKEAYAKALGEGLALPFSSFRASLDRKDVVDFRHDEDAQPVRRAHLFRPHVAAGFSAAVLKLVNDSSSAPKLVKYT